MSARKTLGHLTISLYSRSSCYRRACTDCSKGGLSCALFWRNGMTQWQHEPTLAEYIPKQAEDLGIFGINAARRLTSIPRLSLRIWESGAQTIVPVGPNSAVFCADSLPLAAGCM